MIGNAQNYINIPVWMRQISWNRCNNAEPKRYPIRDLWFTHGRIYVITLNQYHKCISSNRNNNFINKRREKYFTFNLQIASIQTTKRMLSLSYYKCICIYEYYLYLKWYYVYLKCYYVYLKWIWKYILLKITNQWNQTYIKCQDTL